MPNQVKYAIIGGSQGYQTVARLGKGADIGSIDTPFGPSMRIYKMNTQRTEVYFLSRHGEHGYTVSAPFVNYRANIWALKEIGVSRIIAWSGPGAIDRSIPIGELVVPGDMVDEIKNRSYTFYEGLGIGFIRQNPVFCPELAQSIRSSIIKRQGRCRTDDVYVCTQGPRLETPAEIRKFAAYGGTLVGMTLIPEAFLAKELEMCYCPLCYVTNYAEGVVQRGFEPGKLFEGLCTDEEKARVDAAVDLLPELAVEALVNMPHKAECKCQFSMERYKRRGDIGEDWHTWIQRKEE